MAGHPARKVLIYLTFVLVGCQPAQSPAPTADEVENTSSAAVDSDARTAPAQMTVAVATNTTWQASGITVEAGQTVTLTANGQYTFHSDGYQSGPEGIPEAESFLGAWPANDLVGLALIGKIGEAGPAFLVGAGVRLEIEDGGELYFMVNDDILDENVGALEVAAEISGPPAGISDPATSEAGVLLIPELGLLPEMRLRMEIPGGWQPGGVSGETVLASYAGGPGLYPGLNVTLEDRGGRELQEVLDSLLGLLSSPVVNSADSLSISGYPALRSDVSWSSLLGELRALRVFVSIGNRVLIVTFVDRATGLTAQSAAEYGDYLQTLSLAPAQGIRPG